MKQKWYAVLKQSSDEWDNGSFDFDEAKEMLREQGYGQIAVIVNENYCDEEITFEDLFDLREFDNGELAQFVKTAGAWDDIGVQERMVILADRADSALWDEYKSGKTDETVSWSEDILGWIVDRDSGWSYYDTETMDSDDKVWNAGEILSELADDDSQMSAELESPYGSIRTADHYNGWASIADYVQKILNVDLGI